jgi:hypothetical protein
MVKSFMVAVSQCWLLHRHSESTAFCLDGFSESEKRLGNYEKMSNEKCFKTLLKPADTERTHKVGQKTFVVEMRSFVPLYGI